MVHAPEYECDIGAHVFPTAKYRQVRELLAASGELRDEDVLAPAAATRAELERVHEAGYLDDLLGLRWTPRTARSELPLTAGIVRAYVLAAGGTLLASRVALERGACAHLGGGFHHAYAGHGEGFCYVNDLAVAIAALRAEGRVRRAAVVDLDVHQGNGTAAIFAGEPEVFTLSIHQEANYPVPKERSDLDVGLADGTRDGEYLDALDGALERVWSHRPEIVLYQAGADPYRDDQLGGLALTLGGLDARDRRVVDGCARRSIPVVVTLGGGYARRLEDTVAIHAATCRAAIRVARQRSAA